MKKQSKHNQNSGLESRPEHISTAQRQQIDFSRRHENRGLSASTLLATLRTRHPNFYALAEVVGKWVWIAFPEKQPVAVTAILSELGFHWNNRRQTWQHPCGAFPPRHKQFGPRRAFRSYFPADVVPA